MIRAFFLALVMLASSLFAAGQSEAQTQRKAAVSPGAPKSALVGESPSVQRMNEWTVGLAEIGRAHV